VEYLRRSKLIRVEDIDAAVRLFAERQVGRPGSCSTEYVRGREAVMAQSGLVIDLAECEVPCVLQGRGDASEIRW